REEALGEDPKPKVAEEEEEDEEQRRSHQQMEECRKRLAKLLFDGTQMVTNIQVAADLREMQRRTQEAELKLQRVEKLENEAKSSAHKFEEITSKWALAEEITIPQELWQLLNQQQEQCALLLEEKNQLISDLQQELRSKEEQYVQALKEQSDDVHLLLQRMEEQNRHLLKTCRHKLLEVERTFEQERRELLDNNRKEWEEGIQAHNAQELEHLHAHMRKVEEFEKQLKQLQVQDEEDFNSMKIQLEAELQNLEKQIQQVKAAYQLNQEKLDYNLQVLKKQDEENTIIRSQQKRKLNRLHSLLQNLRTKLANQEQQFREEKQSLAAVCERITGQCQEVQRKMRHFAVTDAEKFAEVWLMNEEEAKRLAREALDAHRVIHTQQLGLPWEEPQHWFLTNIGPLGQHRAKRTTTKLAVENLAVGSGEENTAKVEHGVTPPRNISEKTAKRILELVRAELMFLCVQAKAGERTRAEGLWSSSALAEQSLLHISVCLRSPDLLVFKREGGSWGGGGGEGSVQLARPSLQSQGSPGAEGVMDLAKDREDNGSGALPAVDIQPEEVLKILKVFVRDFGKLRQEEGSAREVLVRDSSKDWEYWEALAQVIPAPTLKLWDALVVALEQY
ncbi:DRC1 protein, partial [Aegotheles bennettii]|nr:DRC1 protein [Aegotheles bennettii]